MKRVLSGIDLLAKNPKAVMGRKTRVGVLCHPSSVDSNLQHLATLVDKNATLVALFGPQHGIHGETQDNMIEWQDHFDAKGRPVYSLYGERRKPSDASLKGVDLVIVDLFDVGSRYYTFIYTMFYMLEACGRAKIPVVICDRPNPLGGEFVEGPILDLHFRSFVGLFDLPVCHGMTVGELAQFFCTKLTEPPKAKILKMKGWKRSMLFPETGLLWTLPSPNMPNFEASVFYPGGCLLEGTSLSEGRGTTRPFELMGAPFIDWDAVEAEYLKITRSLKLKPARFHRQGFIPTFHKHHGEVCRGALQICDTPKTFSPLRHTVILLWVLRKLYRSAWSWKQPPYEYEFEKLPFDILMGGTETRLTIDEGRPLQTLFQGWKKDEARFKKSRTAFLLY